MDLKIFVFFFCITSLLCYYGQVSAVDQDKEAVANQNQLFDWPKMFSGSEKESFEAVQQKVSGPRRTLLSAEVGLESKEDKNRLLPEGEVEMKAVKWQILGELIKIAFDVGKEVIKHYMERKVREAQFKTNERAINWPKRRSGLRMSKYKQIYDRNQKTQVYADLLQSLHEMVPSILNQVNRGEEEHASAVAQAKAFSNFGMGGHYPNVMAAGDYSKLMGLQGARTGFHQPSGIGEAVEVTNRDIAQDTSKDA